MLLLLLFKWLTFFFFFFLLVLLLLLPAIAAQGNRPPPPPLPPLPPPPPPAIAAPLSLAPLSPLFPIRSSNLLVLVVNWGGNPFSSAIGSNETSTPSAAASSSSTLLPVPSSTTAAIATSTSTAPLVIATPPATGICASSPCAHGGTCVPVSNTTFWCLCAEYFGGPTCGTILSSVPTVTATFHLVNIAYGWYHASLANVVFFDEAFIRFVCYAFGTTTSSVTIMTVTNGSLIVTFNVMVSSPSAAQSMVTSIDDFIIFPVDAAISMLSDSLPSVAFDDPTVPIYLSSDGSYATVFTPETGVSGSTIAGIVLGSLGGLFLFGIAIAIFLQRKHERGATRLKDEHEEHEMTQ